MGVIYLCRQEECCSTAMGAQGYNRQWLCPAARSRGGRRTSAPLLLGKRPFQSFAHWWRLHQGSCRARTFPLKEGTVSYIDILMYVTYVFLSTFFNRRNTDTNMKSKAGLYAQVHIVAKINQTYL